MNVDAAELERIVAKGEGKTVEFKRGLSSDPKIARTLCAFANTRGGMLLVGVNDDRSLEGVPRPREIVRRLREVAAQDLEPPLKVELRVVEVGERSVVCCSVPLSGRRPHSVARSEGPREVVVRVGSSNRAAGGATLRALTEPRAPAKGLEPLERRALEWVAGRSRRARGPLSTRPDGDATVAGFAKAANVGLQRARRVFTKLERNGRLVGHGFGARRVFTLG